MKLWEELKAEYEQELASKSSEPITVVLPDGKKVEAKSWVTTPYDIAKGIRLESISHLKNSVNEIIFVFSMECVTWLLV